MNEEWGLPLWLQICLILFIFYNNQKGGMEFEDEKSGYGGDDNIEEMLEDLAIGE